MKHGTRATLALLVAALATACGTTGPRADLAQAGGAPGETRRLLSTDEAGPPAEAASPEEALKQAPEALSLAEGERLLVKLDPSEVVAPDGGAAADGSRGYRLRYWGGWGRRWGWGYGYAPYWGGAWGAYSYLPVGSYYFPYYMADGRYMRYASAYSPYFYRWGGGLWPYSRLLW